MDQEKTKIEDQYKPSTKALQEIADFYAGWYKAKNDRSQGYEPIEGKDPESFWLDSRRLFWNGVGADSDDLEALGLDFKLPFIRKEVMDFTGRLVSMNVGLQLLGDGEGQYAVQVLQSMYKKWRLTSKDKVEKFWQLLYGTINGTVCSYVGFDFSERELNFLTALDQANEKYSIDTKYKRMVNDAFTEIVPLEEIYLEKIWERNIQKQNRTWRVQTMDETEFRSQFPEKYFPKAAFAKPGNQITEDSLFYQLLGGAGVLATDKYQVITEYTLRPDTKRTMVNGIWVDELGRGKARPNPFHHKMQPYVWSQHEAADEKFAYGMSTPFKIKGTNKILQTSYVMLVERELRDIDPPIITSDFEAPQLIFGQKRVIPVNDVTAYKEFQLKEASGAYFTMMNSMQGLMNSFAQGGFSQVAPSRQPRSAKEIKELEQLKMEALGNTLIMYYDMLFQEVNLLLKTQLQFYQVGKYLNQEDNLIRSFMLTNAPLGRGGVGNLQVKFVRETTKPLELYFQAIHESIKNGKTTEVIEVPIDALQQIFFYVEDIKLEPEESSDLERAAWNEQVLQPLLNVFIPAGVADVGKTYLRFLEKNGEHPSNFTSDQNMAQMMNQNNLRESMMRLQAIRAAGGQGQGTGAQTGNMNQSMRGQRFGDQNVESLLER